jgi:hypothetical protein
MRLPWAPDGGKEGGPQPTDISRINRRFFLAPALPMHEGKKTGCRPKKSRAQYGFQGVERAASFWLVSPFALCFPSMVECAILAP